MNFKINHNSTNNSQNELQKSYVRVHFHSGFMDLTSFYLWLTFHRIGTHTHKS